jgi:hypothetical protein
MVADLNGDNVAAGKILECFFKFAGPRFHLAKCPLQFAAGVENSRLFARAGARHGQAFDIGAYLERTSVAVNRALDKALPAEQVKPATIHKAMRYSLFAGGKRLRPALCIAAAA